MTTINLAEMHLSIHGELPLLGTPCLIIRLAECNLNCPYCDADFSLKETITLEALKARITNYNCRNLLITGGEPLFQAKAVKELIDWAYIHGYQTLVETNGTIAFKDNLANADYVSMDVKLFQLLTPNVVDNFSLISPQDIIKFVYSDLSELNNAFSIIEEYNLKQYNLVFSPVNPKESYASNIIAYSLANPLASIRLQAQIHKLLELP